MKSSQQIQLCRSHTAMIVFPCSWNTHSWVVICLTISALCCGVLPAPADESLQPASGEAWFVVEFDGQRVGYEQLRWSTSETHPGYLECYRRTEIKLARFGTDLNLSARLSTVQDPRGRLQSFDLTRVDRSGVRLQRSGQYDPRERRFVVTEMKTGSRDVSARPVSDAVWSPILSLWMPSTVGPRQRRTTTPVFFPESAGVAGLVTEYRAGTFLRHNGKRMPVERLNFYPEGDPSRLTTLLFDESGRVLQQEKRVFGGVLKIIQSTAQTALTASRDAVDVDAQSLIPMDGHLGRTNIQRTVELQMVVSEGGIDEPPASAEQLVRRISATEILVTLHVPDPDRRLPSRPGPAAAEFTATSRWMPLQDPALQKLATLGAGPTSDAGMICRRLENFVHRRIRRAPFETSLLTADEVARNLRGDCTEHAVLLASLMRIKGVPSRVVSGLVPVANGYGFQGHTWVEARLGDQWVAFDSAAPTNHVRLKLQHDPLTDALGGGIPLFLPVLDLAGRTRIRVVRESALQRP